MKPSIANSEDETPKVTQNKSNKKSTKSRSKVSKTETIHINTNVTTKNAVNHANNYNCGINVSGNSAPAPTTPTTVLNNPNVFDSVATSSGIGGISDTTVKTNLKNYAGLEPRSIKIIWEQHDQSDVELSSEVCARLAEDASYKLWELISSIKTYARHSGGFVSSDLVNEVLCDSDVPPILGGMDTDWDRINYDGSFFFYSDKIFELRDEYQRDINIKMPDGPDISCSWPLEEKHSELLKKFTSSLFYVMLYGDETSLKSVLSEIAFSPIIGACYRIILSKIIQLTAFKQNDTISARCWRLLRACSVNQHVRDVDCRLLYFHLSEILICQLLAPYESIKVQRLIETDQPGEVGNIKMELDTDNYQKIDINPDTQINLEEQKIKRPVKMENNSEEDSDYSNSSVQSSLNNTSAYFASPVDTKYVDLLCSTIGELASLNGYFHSECIFNVIRRLKKFFDGRNVSTDREYIYISRSVSCLIALGEFAFREFIPFTYMFDASNVPEYLWNDFSLGSIFLNGESDIFLYEWLEYLCGCDKLQPFMVYYALYHEKLLTWRYLKRAKSDFKIIPKIAVRRLEWNTLAAAMCRGDDPDKALRPKPTMKEIFPELIIPNFQYNRPGRTRFKFAGCRPIKVKSKIMSPNEKCTLGRLTHCITEPEASDGVGQTDILIARRKLFKPLTNEKKIIPLRKYTI